MNFIYSKTFILRDVLHINCIPASSSILRHRCLAGLKATTHMCSCWPQAVELHCFPCFSIVMSHWNGRQFLIGFFIELIYDHCICPHINQMKKCNLPRSRFFLPLKPTIASMDSSILAKTLSTRFDQLIDQLKLLTHVLHFPVSWCLLSSASLTFQGIWTNSSGIYLKARTVRLSRNRTCFTFPLKQPNRPFRDHQRLLISILETLCECLSA